MPFATHRSSRFNVYRNTSEVASDEQLSQILVVQQRFFLQLIIDADDILPNQIFWESAPFSLQNDIFHLPLHELNDDPMFLQIYIAQMLESLNIDVALCEIMAGQIASDLLQTVGENREINFHIGAVVDHTELSLWTTIVEEAPRKMEKLEEIGEHLGDCSICLDEFVNSNKTEKRDVVKIPCGHVYHQSCIFKWLHNNNSCPLCRTPLPFEQEDSP